MANAKILKAFPYLRVRNASAAIDYYKRVFGCEENFRLTEPDGRIGHCELQFGEATIAVSDEYPEYGIKGPESFGGTGSSIHLHVDDVDTLSERAVSEGASLLMEPTNQFYGERTAKVKDPYGHEWLIGTRIEKLSLDEMQRRFSELFVSASASDG